MLEAKPSPRENSARIEKSAPPEKPRTLRSVRTGHPKRPTLRPAPTSDASEAEKQLGKIRAKLKDKQTILEHPEALIDAWEALKDFHHPNKQPSEQDLQNLRNTLQKALYEYQARTEKIQTLRVSKTLRTARSQEFEGQREQLEKILSEIMGSDNPAQAKQDSAGAFSEFVAWREQQQRQSMEKQVTDYESQANRLLEKEQDLQEKIQAASGQAVIGNSAEEIRNSLKLSAWQKIKDWAGTLAGNKPVIQLIADLAKIQRERVLLDRKIADSKVNLGQETFRIPKKQPKTEAQAMQDFGLEDLDQVENKISVDQAEQLTSEDMIDQVATQTEAEPNTEKNLATEKILQEIEERADKNAREEEVPERLTEKDVIETKQVTDLKNQLKLLRQTHQEMLEELGMENSTKQDKKSDARTLKAMREYEQQISELEEKIQKLSVSNDNLEELIPEETASSKAPPPPSAAEREKRLDIQAAISGRPRERKNRIPKNLGRPRTVDDEDELYEQTRTILGSASQAARETAPAEKFDIPKKQTLRRPKPSVILSLDSSPVSEKLPTARSTKELPPAYTELQQVIIERLGLLSKEDRLALNFDSKVYAEKAMNRDRAYAAGNEKEGEAYQVSINELNKALNQAGVIGDREDPSMHTGGKSGGLKILGGDFLSKNSDQYTKLIPTARKSRDLKRIQQPETAEAPTLSAPWAQANLGESASSTWQRVAPIIAERNLGPTISKRLESLMQEAGTLNLKGTSIDYQSLPELMKKVKANSAYASSPEASAYVLLKAFKPKNEQDKKIQPLIDRAIKAIDSHLLEIKPVVQSFMQKSEANKKTREQRQSLRRFDLLPSQPQKTAADPKEVTRLFKQKNKGRVVERSMAELIARDKKKQTEVLSQPEREKLISRAGAKNAKRFGMLLDDYLQSLPLKDKTTALAQDRLLQEATALGLKKEPVMTKLISLYTKEVPQAPKKPRTARTKRTAR